MDNLLEVKNLQTAFNTEKGKIICVDDVSFHLKPGETLGIVGESGCGKSVTSLSIMDLLGSNGFIIGGEILFNEKKLLKLNEKEMCKIRGNEISMIFQEPMTSLNPVFTVGYQLMEGIKLHLNMNKKKSQVYAIELLNKVGIPRAEKIMNEYPQALSGGMRQRVMIAMALACKPKLLIADEPTTALDVTIQAQILDLMKELRKDFDMSIMLITHDLGIIAEMADRAVIMYAGQIVEEADVFELFDYPKHPYTKGLMNSIPQIYEDKEKRLTSINGTVPSYYQNMKGCRFRTRCSSVTEKCHNEVPPLIELTDNHLVRCWLFKELGKNSKEEI